MGPFLFLFLKEKVQYNNRSIDGHALPSPPERFEEKKVEIKWKRSKHIEKELPRGQHENLFLFSFFRIVDK